MKKILLLLLLSCALPAVAETISAVTFNPTRMGNYEQLRVSRRAVFRGGLQVMEADPGVSTFFQINSGAGSTITIKNDTTTSPVRKYYFNTITGTFWNEGTNTDTWPYTGWASSIRPTDKETIDMADATFVGYDPQQPDALRPTGLYSYDIWYGLPREGHQLSDSVHAPLTSYEGKSYPIVSAIVTKGGRFGFKGVGSDGVLAPSYIGNLRTKSVVDLGTSVTEAKYAQAADSLLIWANKLLIRPNNTEDSAYLHVRGTTALPSDVATFSPMKFLKKLQYSDTDASLGPSDNPQASRNLENDYVSSSNSFMLAGFPVPFPGPGSVAKYTMSQASGKHRHRETLYRVVKDDDSETFFLDPTTKGITNVHNTCFFQWIERMTSGIHTSTNWEGGETVYVLGLGPCLANSMPGYAGTVIGHSLYPNDCSSDDCLDLWEPWAP